MTNGFHDDDHSDLETLQRQSWPCLRQFCVFVENRVGRLSELMRKVESLDTRVLAMNIVDSVDFAMIRLMFDNADRAREKLELSGFLFSENDVVGVELPEGDQPFHLVCKTLMTAEVNIHHAYPLIYRRNRGAMALFVDNVDGALAILSSAGFRVVTESDLQSDDFF
ncbi:MAG: acetolactate synthase [Planctomycetes bacterium]|nr:acetolactate synthase [Planctomycetota bacterium]